jgi:5'-nucleotidase
VKNIKEEKFLKDICLNINIPKSYKDIKVVSLRISDFNENVESVIDGKSNFHTNFSVMYISGKKNKLSDVDMTDKGYISVVPLQINQINFSMIKNTKN